MNIARCLSTAFYVEIYVNMSFVNIMLCCHFSLEALFLQDTAKNNPTENKSKQKLQSDIKACTSMKTDRREHVKFLQIFTFLQITRIYLHHKLQLLIRICFLLDYRLLFIRFWLVILSVCFFVGKNIAQKLLLF